ncbi:hypothetical protein QOZ80_5BG0442960 [Eleusine coracana subsp. coracana]|nr:hypothetical protein QOZ80_5BG0442960 [Eleusine coracana subsp. coracana]
MAGADGDVTRWAWAASFMARLFTGAAAPAQLLAEEDVFSSSGGGGCNSLYRSVSTVEDVELDGDLEADAGESEEQLLAADEGEDPTRARSVYCERGLSHGGVQHTQARELGLRRRSTGAAPRSGGATMEEAAESEPLVLRCCAAKRANDAVETIDHPFGCGRREKESSSLLLLSSS